MGKGERKLILILLIIILIFSSILIIKINSQPKYDEKLYDKVYSEYNKIFDIGGDSTSISQNTNNNMSIRKGSFSEGTKTLVLGKIIIPKIEISYPIISETTNEYLKIAPAKLLGPEVNEIGNLCVVGHNYENKEFFSKLHELDIGDQVYILKAQGKEMEYIVYDKYEVNENDMSCTSQDTNGKIELTLITCTNVKTHRLVVKCRAKI